MAGAYRVLLTEGAEHDLDAIYDYIAESNETSNADYVLSRLMATAEQLSSFPHRGSYPRELLNIGIKEYRQVFFKPYRLIYRIVGKQVVVYMIADSRRDLQSLLARRLLGSR